MNTGPTKKCFVISPIGEEGSDIRKRADQTLRFIIRPAIEPSGYQVYRADEALKPGIITEQILHHLIQAELVVADLTGLNPNVFYELAISHALHKPTFHLISKGQDVPFDVSILTVIRYDLQDLDSVHQATQNLQDQLSRVPASGKIQVFPSIYVDQVQGAEQNGSARLTERVDRIFVSIDELGRRIREVHDSISTVPKKQLDELWSFVASRAADGGLPTNKDEYELMVRLETDVRIGDTAYAQGDLGLALAIYERVLEAAPGHKLALIGKGKVLRKRWEASGNIADLFAALAVVEECVKSNPRYERGYYNRACYKALLLREGHAKLRDEVILTVEDAVSDLRQAIKLFDYYRNFAHSDKDFDEIRKDPSFSDLLKE